MADAIISYPFGDFNAVPSTPGVYCIRFPNGKEYVGKTVRSLRLRLSEHLSATRRGNTGLRVHRALAAMPEASVRIIATGAGLGNEALSAMERASIAERRAKGIRLYNDTDGGDGAPGFSHAAAVRQRMSESAQRSWTKERQERAKARLADPEVNARMRKAQKQAWTDDRRRLYAERMQVKARKLASEDALAIASLLSEGASCASIARNYGVTPEAISSIKTGRTWGSVTGICRADLGKNTASAGNPD